MPQRLVTTETRRDAIQHRRELSPPPMRVYAMSRGDRGVFRCCHKLRTMPRSPRLPAQTRQHQQSRSTAAVLDTTALNQLGQAPAPSSRAGSHVQGNIGVSGRPDPIFTPVRRPPAGYGARVIIQRVQRTLSLGQCIFRVHDTHVRSIG
jgi:hypothetical protein